MKKFISIILTLALVLSIVAIGAVSVSAAEIKAPSWEKKADNKVYFYAEPKLFSYFTSIYLYIYEHGRDEVILWGSKKGKMTNEGNNVWSFDFSEKGIELDSRKQYGLIFTTDWENQTCDLIFSTECLGDMVYCDGRRVENSIDSNKNSLITEWVNADRSKYAPPVCITSSGNVIGEAYWTGETAYSLFVAFLTNKDYYRGLDWIIKFSGMSARETAEHVAEGLGLSDDEFDRAVEEAGIDLDHYDPVVPAWYGMGFEDTEGMFTDYETMYAYVYEENDGGIFPWGSEECEMYEMFDNYYWFDLPDDFSFDPEKTYYVIFTADWKDCTNPLLFDEENNNNYAETTGVILSGEGADGHKVFEAEWHYSDWGAYYPWFRFYADEEIVGEEIESVTAYVYDGEKQEGFPQGGDSFEMMSHDYITWDCDLYDYDYPIFGDNDYWVYFVINGKHYTNSLPLSPNCTGYTSYLTGKTLGTGSGGVKMFEAEWDPEPEYFELEKPQWKQRSDGKVYFWSGNIEEEFETPYIDINFVDDEGFWVSLFDWESEEERAMTNEGGGVWSYDVSQLGIDLNGDNYFIGVSLDNMTESGYLPLTSDNLGDMIYFTSYMKRISRSNYYYSDWVNYIDPFELTPGDLNRNGELDIQDVTILQQHLAEFTIDGDPIIDEDNDFQMYIADYNGDGDLTIEDVTAMQRSLAEFASFAM